MGLLTQYHSELESLSFLSGIVVAIAACVGLYQLVLAKRSAEANAKRDAFRVAAQQCELYLTRVIPLLSQLDVAAKQNGITSFGKSRIEFKNGEVHLQVTQTNNITHKMIAIAEPFTSAMNALESFALHFINGIAAEEPAFVCIGKTYCDSVNNLLPELVPLADDGYYTHVVKLYARWQAKYEKARIEKQKIMLDQRNNEIRDVKIKVIGL